MKAFLKYVAEDIIHKYGTNLSNIVVVFPNKRASLFLNKYLLETAGKPIWSPRYITISELFRSQTKLTVADNIKTICMLYKTYKELTKTEETLDRFWSWGEIMLADFDDLDKNMGDAELIFSNVRDLHAFDTVDFLDDEKKQLLKKFFAEFTDNHDSKIKMRFELLWNQLFSIYKEFRKSMFAEELAYEGAMYREVAERADKLEWKHSKYLFVGFNMIQKVEQILFSSMKNKGLAHFYWDFDHYYLDDTRQEAGRFIEKYLVNFPNELDIKNEEIYNNFSSPKDITYLSASTENIQARYISQWLKENGRMDEGTRTAIVLADESLLKSVIHYLPKEVSGNTNITIGYPLSQSPVASFINNFLSLHIHGYNVQEEVYILRHAETMLRHPYTHLLSEQSITLPAHLRRERLFFPSKDNLCLDEGLTMLFQPINESRSEMNSILIQRLLTLLQAIGEKSEENRLADEEETSRQNSLTYEEQFLQESVYKMYNIINRLNDLITNDGLEVDPTTLLRLTDQITQQTTMPFHGEPAVGLQIMGVLETRNLDFDHVLLLSCNEGNLPKGINDSSLIPYSIRKAFSLTTVDNKVAIYAYYFYRLMQRCADINIAYNSSTEDGQTGQMSRFMLQMMVETNKETVTLHHKNLTAKQSPKSTERQEVAKDEKIMQELNNITYLSPSAINRYLRCPLQFYYNTVVKIKEADSGEITDARMFGNIFHKAAEKIYAEIRTNDNEITQSAIDSLLNEKSKKIIERIVDEAFSEELFNNKAPRYDGLQLINREVICRFIIQMLKGDRQLAPFYVKGIEAEAYENMTFNINGLPRTITIGGYIDRLDQLHNTEGKDVLRVLDYKTGRNMQALLTGVEEVFYPEKIEGHSDYYFQTMLYSIIVRHMTKPVTLRGETKDALNTDSLPVQPALLFIQRPDSINAPVLKFGDKKSSESIQDILDYEKEFREQLQTLVSEIFNPDIPFTPTPTEKRCETCAFAILCRK